MNTYFRFPTCITTLAALLLSTVIGLSGGCGGSGADTVMDAGALLERYEKDRRRHDPLHFSEVDLGEFTVSQRDSAAIFHTRFHLYAVVPDSLVDQFNEALKTHAERVRSKVRESTQRCDVDKIDDPSLGWLKSDLITSINRIVRAPMVRDVVFAEFTFERG